ncbi:MAG: PemK family transcriptional regulator [Chloroflexi bacterium HGW-Chloroflexi-1]|nr:MAG: PemK family transcriptional regulator [Chloroflexi bacterium HGW-Chloroflexi-1]
MKRGEVRWIDFELPDKRRPAVILTRNSAIGYLGSVTVAPITTTIRETPSQVRLGQGDGLQAECAVNLHNLQTVSKAKVGGWIAVLSESRMDTIEAALLFALGMDRRLRRG